MTFAREIVTDELLKESFPLIQSHYEEIAHFKDIPLEPDFEQYIKLEEMGIIRFYIVRDEDNQMIGYALFFVKSNLHYKSSLQAIQDVLFIDDKHRGKGLKFIKWCDEQLKSEGVVAVYHHVKVKQDFGPALERIGYEFIDKIYGKQLT